MLNHNHLRLFGSVHQSDLTAPCPMEFKLRPGEFPRAGRLVAVLDLQEHIQAMVAHQEVWDAAAHAGEALDGRADRLEGQHDSAVVAVEIGGASHWTATNPSCTGRAVHRWPVTCFFSPAISAMPLLQATQPVSGSVPGMFACSGCFS